MHTGKQVQEAGFDLGIYIKKYILLFLILLVGCSTNIDPINDGGGHSDFKQDQVSLIDVTDIPGEGIWKQLQGHVLYTFSVCFKDLAGLEIIGRPFLIQGPNSHIKTSSNLQGCIEWDEPIEYNYTAEEKFFEFPVEFTGLDVYKGKVISKIIVQPWDGYAIDATNGHYLEKQYPTAVTSSMQALHANENFAHLLVKEASVRLEEQTRKTRYSVTLTPYLVRKLLAGDKKEQLTAGKFKINFLLYEKDLISGQYLRVIDRYVGEPTSMENDKLTISAEFDIRDIDHHNFLEMAFELIPVDLPQGISLAPTSGYVRLGGGTADGTNPGLWDAKKLSVLSLKESQVIRKLAEMRDMNPDDLLMAGHDPMASLMQAIPYYDSLYEKPPSDLGPTTNRIYYSFEQTPVKLENVTKIESPEQDGWEQLNGKILFTFSVCFRDSTNRKIVKQNFKVQGPNTLYPKIPTDPDGCIKWDQPIDFNYVQKEKSFYFNVNFTGLDRYRGTKTSKMIIQPWDQYAVDATVDNYYTKKENLFPLEDSIKTSTSKEDIAHLLVEEASARLDRLGDNMHYSVSMYPYLLRETMDGGEKKEKLFAGRYRVNFVLYESALTQNTVSKIIDTFSSDSVSSVDHNLTIKTVFHIQKINPHNFLMLAFELIPIDPPYGGLSSEKGVIRLGGGSSDGSTTGIAGVSNADVFGLTSQKILSELEKIKTKKPKTIPHKSSNPLPGFFNRAPVVAGTDSFFSFPEVEQDIDKTVLSENFVGKDNTEEEKIVVELRPSDFRIDRVLFLESFMDPDDGDQTKKENRVKTVLLETCLIDNKGSSPVSNLYFDMAVTADFQDPVFERVEIRNNGCLPFKLKIPYNYYGSRFYKNFQVIVKGLNSDKHPYASREQSRDICIYPWNNVQVQLGYDLSTFCPKAHDMKSIIHVDRIDYSSHGNLDDTFKINPLLNISFKRHYRLRINPILKYWDYKEGLYRNNADTPLLEGKYKIRFLLLAPHYSNVQYHPVKFENFQPMAKVEQTVDLIYGARGEELLFDLELPINFADLPLLGVKNLVMLEIGPADSQSKLSPMIATSYFYNTLFNFSMGVGSEHLEGPSRGELRREDEYKREEYLHLKKLMDRFWDNVPTVLAENIPPNVGKYIMNKSMMLDSEELAQRTDYSHEDDASSLTLDRGDFTLSELNHMANNNDIIKLLDIKYQRPNGVTNRKWNRERFRELIPHNALSPLKITPQELKSMISFDASNKIDPRFFRKFCSLFYDPEKELTEEEQEEIRKRNTQHLQTCREETLEDGLEECGEEYDWESHRRYFENLWPESIRPNQNMQSILNFLYKKKMAPPPVRSMSVYEFIGCRQNPFAFMRFSPVAYIKKITRQPRSEDIVTYQNKLKYGVRFDFATGERYSQHDREMEGYDVSRLQLSYRPEFFILDLLRIRPNYWGAGIGIRSSANLKMGVTSAYTRSRMLYANERRYGGMDKADLIVEETKVSFNADLTRCVILTPRPHPVPKLFGGRGKPNYNREFFISAFIPLVAHLILLDHLDYTSLVNEIDTGKSSEFTSPAKIFQICEDEPEYNVPLTEHYYHLTAFNQPGGLSINRSAPSHHELTQVIRGNKSFEMLWGVLLKNHKLKMVIDSANLKLTPNRRLKDFYLEMIHQELDRNSGITHEKNIDQNILNKFDQGLIENAKFRYTIPGMYVPPDRRFLNDFPTNEDIDNQETSVNGDDANNQSEDSKKIDLFPNIIFNN